MGYHRVDFTIEDDTRDDRHFYEVTTYWHETDEKFGRGHDSVAYTDASEGHRILRWTTNDRVVPADIMEKIDWPHKAEMDAARDADLDAFMVSYREAQANRTPEQIAEERFEARAAHGPGVEMVNVFTGERYTT